MTQLVECLRHMEEVRGSSPLLPTIRNQNRTRFWLRFFIHILICKSEIIKLSKKDSNMLLHYNISKSVKIGFNLLNGST